MQPVITFILPRVYIHPVDNRVILRIDECLLQRTAAPYIWGNSCRSRAVVMTVVSGSPLVAWGRPDERSFLHPKMRRPGSGAGIIGLERARFSQRRAGAIDPLQAWPCFALNV